MMMKLKIVLGDWSNDGHGKTSDYYIEVNKTIDEMNAAYQKSKKKFDFVNNVASEYEDSKIMSLDAEEFFMKRGFDFDTLETLQEKFSYSIKLEDVIIDGVVEDSIPLYEQDYVKLLIFHIGCELEDFTWKFVNEDVKQLDTNDYMGYGLF